MITLSHLAGSVAYTSVILLSHPSSVGHVRDACLVNTCPMDIAVVSRLCFPLTETCVCGGGLWRTLAEKEMNA